MTDRLFLSRKDIGSGRVQVNLDWNAVSDDEFTGAEGQKLHVFSALSNEAVTDLLGRFDLGSYEMPLLQTHEGKVITDSKKIIAYLKKNGMSDRRGL